MEASGGAGADAGECPQSILHAPCRLSEDVRRALWCGVREYGTSWRSIRQNYPACADIDEPKLAYFAKRLGMVEVLEGAKRLRGGLTDRIDRTEAQSSISALAPAPAPVDSYDSSGYEFSGEAIDSDPHSNSDNDVENESREGAGYVRRAQLDRSSCESEQSLLQATYARAAPPLRVCCSDCRAVLTPEDVSCWCRGCTVYRCGRCSDDHRRGVSGLFHVTEVYDPDLGLKTVLRAYVGDTLCTLPGFQFCPGCGDGGLSTSPETRAVTLIGESFGVERVLVPARQKCVALGCGCVQDVTDILCNLYEFERQTSLLRHDIIVLRKSLQHLRECVQQVSYFRWYILFFKSLKRLCLGV
jgi:hypothetical protein